MENSTLSLLFVDFLGKKKSASYSCVEALTIKLKSSVNSYTPIHKKSA